MFKVFVLMVVFFGPDDNVEQKELAVYSGVTACNRSVELIHEHMPEYFSAFCVKAESPHFVM